MEISIEWIKDAVVFVAVPVIRSAAGWLQNSLKDGKIQNVEWKKLAYTTVKIGTTSLMIYLGANSVGVDVNALGASAAAFVVDRLFDSIKENKNVTQRG
jgi:CRISPR/Cas system-associated endoribonuclease Cas2